MKNRELELVLRGINEAGNLKGIKFGYALSKNRKMIEPELETLKDAKKPDKDFDEYTEKRVIVCEKYAIKDDRGNFELVNGQYQFTNENRKKFEKELEPLNKEYGKVIDARNKQLREYNELLNKESDFKPHKIDYKDVPEDITVSVMNKLSYLINEPK